MEKTVKLRDSNIELFRILLMLMIIAHHYVVHSGVIDVYDLRNFGHEISGNRVFLELWGWGGKTGINCFLLITGFFMCKLDFTWKKLLKLYLQIKFYTLLLPFVFWAFGGQQLSVSDCFNTLFWVAGTMGNSFPSTFLALFMLVPFMNLLINSMNRKGHLALLLLLFLFYTINGTFFLNFNFEYIGWSVTVYLIGAYLRLYPLVFLKDVKKSIWISVISVLLCFISILVFTFFRESFKCYIYFLIDGPNKLLAILTAVALFSMFRILNISYNKWINFIASATFGVYLIHDDPYVRSWLWENVVRVKDYFNSDWLWLHAICSCVAVYVVCCVIDILRQKLIEKPLFDWLDKKYPSLNKGYRIERSEYKS